MITCKFLPNHQNPKIFLVRRNNPVFLFFLCIFFVIASPKAFARQEVRVLVAENQKSVVLSVKGDYVIRALPTLQVVKKGRRLSGAVLSVSSNGWNLGQEVLAAQGLRIEPVQDRDLILNKSSFRGKLDILKDKNGFLDAVNRIDMESYLYGVLHHEVASWWPMEALRAQSIAARTYALYQSQVNKTAEYDLKSSTSSQVYGGSTTERYRTNLAVDQTAGKIL